MHRLVPRAMLISVMLVVAAIGLIAASACGGQATATGVASPAPSPAPSWVVNAAATQATRYGDPHPTAAYWGLLHDPQLGELTASGPNDPSHKAYVIVLVGDFSQMYSRLSYPAPGGSPPPQPPIKWVYFLYTTATHEDGGSFGFGVKDFDVSAYPELQPFSL